MRKVRLNVLTLTGHTGAMRGRGKQHATYLNSLCKCFAEESSVEITITGSCGEPLWPTSLYYTQKKKNEKNPSYIALSYFILDFVKHHRTVDVKHCSLRKWSIFFRDSCFSIQGNISSHMFVHAYTSQVQLCGSRIYNSWDNHYH